MNIMRSACYKEYGEPSTMLKNRMIKVALIRKNQQASPSRYLKAYRRLTGCLMIIRSRGTESRLLLAAERMTADQ